MKDAFMNGFEAEIDKLAKKKKVVKMVRCPITGDMIPEIGQKLGPGKGKGLGRGRGPGAGPGKGAGRALMKKLKEKAK